MHNSFRGFRSSVLLTLCLLALHALAPAPRAQETSPTAVQSPQKGPAVRITFLPPPLEGTLSLAVFDRSGKRVRSLHTEVANTDLTISLNGLSTTWDGKDDAGQLLPPGKYRVRGLAVGDLELTGEAFHGNDWVAAEDCPHPAFFHSQRLEGNTLELTATDIAGQLWRITESVTDSDDTPRFEKTAPPAEGAIPSGPTSCAGREGTRWSIEKALGETIIVQLDANSEVLRRLSVGAGQPVPVAIAASLTEDEVFLLEQDGDRWRVRGLRKKAAPEPGAVATPGPAPTAASSPSWETFFEKNRWPCSQFSDAAPRVGRPKPFVPEPQVSIKSQFNPLLGGASTDVFLSVGFDDAGSFLKTNDGILLRRLTDTQKLRWAVLGHDARQPAVVLLQSDGAVVEEYRILQPGMLMTFDAGEYQWTGK
ncbi:MAG: hypothetical protein DVB28_001874 [Verrucomicrobia bacterium]|nr:MAG: hypothetical protein DVB28_001874 [Verrucomicrobiota bacterium]